MGASKWCRRSLSMKRGVAAVEGYPKSLRRLRGNGVCEWQEELHDFFQEEMNERRQDQRVKGRQRVFLFFIVCSPSVSQAKTPISAALCFFPAFLFFLELIGR